jgi:hypothetical protein
MSAGLTHICSGCGTPVPRPEDGYQIGTEQIATMAALFWWSAHLMSKRWLPMTDWDELMREAADGTGARIISLASAA